MPLLARSVPPAIALFTLAACSSPGPGGFAGADAGDDAPAPCTTRNASRIEHLVLIVQENHTFDNHFGAYCTAKPGSNPTCTDGPTCCEAAPPTDRAGVAPTVLDDDALGHWDPDHTSACESAEMDDGKMDTTRPTRPVARRRTSPTPTLAS